MILFTFPFVFSNILAGQMTRHLYEGMRREAASLNIQKYIRRFLKRKAYNNLRFSAISIQASLRAFCARNELRSRKRTVAATVIQVKIEISFKQGNINSYYFPLYFLFYAMFLRIQPRRTYIFPLLSPINRIQKLESMLNRTYYLDPAFPLF